MERGRKIRFISEEPKLGTWLKTRKPIVLPQDIYDWATDWVHDVGAVMRSREMMVSTVASAAYYVILMGLVRLISATQLREVVRLPIIKEFLEGLGVRLG